MSLSKYIHRSSSLLLQHQFINLSKRRRNNMMMIQKCCLLLSTSTSASVTGSSTIGNAKKSVTDLLRSTTSIKKKEENFIINKKEDRETTASTSEKIITKTATTCSTETKNNDSSTNIGVPVVQYRTNDEITILLKQRIKERNNFLVYGQFEDTILPLQQNPIDISTRLISSFMNYTIPNELYRDTHFPVQPMNWNTIKQYNTTNTNTNTNSTANNNNTIQTTWIGHSTVVVQMDDYTILTDPIFSKTASPYGTMIGPKRLRKLPCTINELMSNFQSKQAQYQEQQLSKKNSSSPIDIVLISHNHYDHLDYCSVRDIVSYCTTNNCVTPIFIVPLGVRRWFETYISKKLTIYEMDWYETIQIPKPKSSTSTSTSNATSTTEQSDQLMEITCLPMKHWSSRYVFDRDYSLWCGYKVATTTTTTTTNITNNNNSDCTKQSSTSTSITNNHDKNNDEKKTKSFLFTGDTAWFDEIETIIGQQYGPYDVAAIPIGAYEPRDFMKTNHINPTEAVQMKDCINAKYAIPIHYGTFSLTTESYLDPIQQLQSLMKHRTDSHTFVPWYIGETKTFIV